MSSKLTSTNPYLRDPVIRERTILRSVATSSAIEGIHAPFKKISRSATTGQFTSQSSTLVKKR